TIVDAGGRQVGVVDFAAETSKAHRVPNILNQVFWLDGKKAALLIGRTHIAIYDRAKDELTAAHAPEAVIEKMLLPSPGGKRVLISTNRGLQILEVETGSFTPVPLPVEQIVWVSDEALMCSNNQTNSEARGVWIF